MAAAPRRRRPMKRPRRVRDTADEVVKRRSAGAGAGRRQSVWRVCRRPGLAEGVARQVDSFDPLAAPSWMAPAERVAATADEESDATTLEELRSAASAIIIIADGQRIARIGSQDYHVGDFVGPYQITDISSAGIVLSEPTAGSLTISTPRGLLGGGHARRFRQLRRRTMRIARTAAWVVTSCALALSAADPAYTEQTPISEMPGAHRADGRSAGAAGCGAGRP